MWEVNRLKDARFCDGLGAFTLDPRGYWDCNNICNDLIPVRFNISDLIEDADSKLTSYNLIVHPDEVYSASIICKTFNYELFDAEDPQVTLTLKGLDANNEIVEILGVDTKNKADFPAQDWFRLKIENIVIPEGVQYLQLVASLKRNGDILFLYPCIEFGDKASDIYIYNSNIGEYYNKMIYEGVVETDEIIKTENIAFDQVNQETATVQRNFYLLTSDEEGVQRYEDELSITSDPLREDLEFRRQRILNRFSNLVPYTFPFLQGKLDQILGVDKWKAYIDFPAFTIYVEYAAVSQLWSDEIKVTFAGVVPCNMIFTSVPSMAADIGISEQVNLSGLTANYKLQGTWKLGQKPFANLQDKGIVKMASEKSVEDIMLSKMAMFTSDTIQKLKINNSLIITEFQVKDVSASTVSLSYVVPASSGITEITNIKLLSTLDEVLTNTPVYIPVTGDNLLKHTLRLMEVNA